MTTPLLHQSSTEHAMNCSAVHTQTGEISHNFKGAVCWY